MDLALHHLKENAIYDVEIRAGYAKAPVMKMKGSDLARLHVDLPQRSSSELVFYRTAALVLPTALPTPPDYTHSMKHLIAILLSGAALAGRAQVTDLTSADLWKPANPPFAFKYDGKDSSAVLPNWQASDENATAGGQAIHHYIYVDPDTRLTVTAEVQTYPDFPGAVNWVLHFKNDGTKDTPIIENILPLHWSIPTAPGDGIVRHAKGSSANSDDFRPLEERFGPNGNDHQESPRRKSIER